MVDNKNSFYYILFASLKGIKLIAEIFVKINIEQLENDAYLATSDDVPGLVAQGSTVAETLEIAQDVTRKLTESYIEHGDELPPQLRRHRPEKFEIDIPVGVSSWDD